jgi:hypothetical protein
MDGEVMTLLKIFSEAVGIVVDPVKFIKDVVKESVVPRNGSIVYCNLYALEHSGIYIAKYQKIMHRNRHGDIEMVTPEEFGDNYESIFVSSYKSLPSGSNKAADNAMKIYNNNCGTYDVISKNCHQFTAACLTGNININTMAFTHLKLIISDEMVFDNWRMWKKEGNEFLYR